MERELKKIVSELTKLRIGLVGEEGGGASSCGALEVCMEKAHTYKGMTLTKTDRLAMKEALEKELRKRNPNL